MTDTVRVRMAPSPTGYLHVGGARTALFNWLFARRHGGKFILRIEDTDRTRYVPDALDDILAGLRWLGLDWDEGPEVGGDYGPYFQSQRLEMYRHYARQLVDEGHAYPCYCSPQRLARLRQEQRQGGESDIGYDRHCRHLSARERAAYEAQGIVPVVRLKVPLEGEVCFHDIVYGDICKDNASIRDPVLLKSDGWPTYHLANVIDDHHMAITHIMRGDEWLSSVPIHVHLYAAFGWEPPVYAHLPIILDPTGKGKMSKRKKMAGGVEYPVFVREFRAAGYLPEAMFNFLAGIGWSYDPEVEIFTRQQAISRFALEDLNSSPAAFPFDKLEWMNGVYIRELPEEELYERLLPFVAADLGLSEGELRSRPELRLFIPLIRERIKLLSEATPFIDFAFTDQVHVKPELLVGKNMTAAESLAALRAARAALAEMPTFDAEALEKRLRLLATELGLKTGQLFGILRLATTGKEVAPPLFGTLAILGRERVLARCQAAERLLETLTT
ncbi:MAG: glutamate--tRNA ligase [Anaerolineae bacterium]|nr:glutamate--tRNA ligase [Anaerolineae bacterium]